MTLLMLCICSEHVLILWGLIMVLLILKVATLGDGALNNVDAGRVIRGFASTVNFLSYYWGCCRWQITFLNANEFLGILRLLCSGLWHLVYCYS